MLLDRVDFFVAERRAASPPRPSVPKLPSRWWRPARPAICAISAMRQAAVAAAVELLEPGEGDVGDVHVEAHADGVGGDQIIDLAALEHRDLGVAGCGRQRAHHHRRAAAEAAQHFGERVDLLGREGDDGGARRQPRQLGAAGVAQGREARPADDLRLGQQFADDRLASVSEPRISVSSRPRARSIRSVKTWPRSGSMPSWASSIAAKAKSAGRSPRGASCRSATGIDFGGAQQIARLGRDDPLLAGQQRDLLVALHRRRRGHRPRAPAAAAESR